MANYLDTIDSIERIQMQFIKKCYTKILGAKVSEKVCKSVKRFYTLSSRWLIYQNSYFVL